MSDQHGIGVGGLTSTREDFTTSRFNHYAEFEFENEVRTFRVFYNYFICFF